MKKILEIVAKNTGQASHVQLLKQHITFLIGKWFSSGYKLEMFPYGLLSCSTEKQFYLEHIDDIVPFLMEEGNLDLLSSICGDIGKNVAEVVEVNLHFIL